MDTSTTRKQGCVNHNYIIKFCIHEHIRILQQIKEFMELWSEYVQYHLIVIPCT